MITNNLNMAVIADMLLPGLYDLQGCGHPLIKSTRLWVNHVNDDLELGVIYKLFDRHDLETGNYKRLFRPRLSDILQINDNTPKQLRAERRRMLGRGNEARKAKAKKKSNDRRWAY